MKELSISQTLELRGKYIKQITEIDQQIFDTYKKIEETKTKLLNKPFNNIQIKNKDKSKNKNNKSKNNMLYICKNRKQCNGKGKINIKKKQFIITHKCDETISHFNIDYNEFM